jgi:hypothetical protein
VTGGQAFSTGTHVPTVPSPISPFLAWVDYSSTERQRIDANGIARALHLYQRAAGHRPGQRMPPLASHRRHELYLEVLEHWLDSPAPPAPSEPGKIGARLVRCCTRTGGGRRGARQIGPYGAFVERAKVSTISGLVPRAALAANVALAVSGVLRLQQSSRSFP